MFLDSQHVKLNKFFLKKMIYHKEKKPLGPFTQKWNKMRRTPQTGKSSRLLNQKCENFEKEYLNLRPTLKGETAYLFKTDSPPHPSTLKIYRDMKQRTSLPKVFYCTQLKDQKCKMSTNYRFSVWIDNKKININFSFKNGISLNHVYSCTINLFSFLIFIHRPYLFL